MRVVEVAGSFIVDLSERMDLPPSCMFATLRVPKAAAARKRGTGDVVDGRAIAVIGCDWLTAQRPGLLLPSGILPEAFIALINPVRPSAGKIAAQAIRAFECGTLFRR